MKSKIYVSVFLFAASIFPKLSSAQIIVGGTNFSLALCSDSTVNTWGSNAKGQLGDGTNTDSPIPLQLNSLSGIISIKAGEQHALALKNDGTVWAWGQNNSGQLGNGSNTNSNIPVQVNTLTGIIAIGAGTYHSLALKNDGTVWAWGNNVLGQLGDGTNIASNVPVQITAFAGITITAIAGGFHHSMALQNDSTVWTWGSNGDGQLGDGTNTSSSLPVHLTAPVEITAIATGLYHYSIALKSNGTVWTWGRNSYGQLGDGSNTDRNIPVQATALAGITAIAGGSYHSLALKNDGTVWVSGDNYYGAFGNGNNTSSNVHVQTSSSLTNVNAIAGGGAHSLALKSDGTLWAWGYNGDGQLGNGGFSPSNLPWQSTAYCTSSAAIKESAEELISVYPNPAYENIFIKGVELGSVIQIFDGTGRLILETKSITNSLIIISELNAGIYFVLVKTNEGNVMHSKFVKE